MIDPELIDDPAEDVRLSTVRQFAGLWLLVFGAIAVRQLWFHGAIVKGSLTALVAAIVPFFAVVNPRLVTWLFVGLSAVTRPIGKYVTLLLLAVIYFSVFTLLALALRLTGHDALSRRRTTGRSYWSGKRQPPNSQSYFRQA